MSRYVKICSWCGRRFHTNASNATLCSAECRKANMLDINRGPSHIGLPQLPLPLPPDGGEEQEWREYFAALYYRRRLEPEWYD